MDRVIAPRAKLKALASESDRVPSINDVIIKAAAIALREHPLANSFYQNDSFVLHDQGNVGIAVAANEPAPCTDHVRRRRLPREYPRAARSPTETRPLTGGRAIMAG